MRTLFDELNPAKQGDLFTPTKILGIPVPFGNKLASYLRRYESADSQLAKLQTTLLQAKDEIAKDVAEMGVARQQLWASLEKLEGASYFIRSLDERLSGIIAGMKTSEPDRARALEQEVLYYVRQNLGDVQAAQALAINAYNVLSELRKTGRETINGCDRVSTLGMAALSVAVTLARATGNQIKTQQMLNAAKSDINNLISATGDALNAHVDATAKFASEPLLGVQQLQNMFDKTFSAMDKMEKYRSEALTTMQTNNQMMREQLVKAQERITNDRKANTGGDAAIKPILDLS
ncbi:MAG: toxic anion resistance protein [Burkholderiales bacterium]|nr:toxic anion resistance protein [Burkholderiales bacterium]